MTLPANVETSVSSVTVVVACGEIRTSCRTRKNRRSISSIEEDTLALRTFLAISQDDYIVASLSLGGGRGGVTKF